MEKQKVLHKVKKNSLFVKLRLAASELTTKHLQEYMTLVTEQNDKLVQLLLAQGVECHDLSMKQKEENDETTFDDEDSSSASALKHSMQAREMLARHHSMEKTLTTLHKQTLRTLLYRQNDELGLYEDDESSQRRAFVAKMTEEEIELMTQVQDMEWSEEYRKREKKDVGSTRKRRVDYEDKRKSKNAKV